MAYGVLASIKDDLFITNTNQDTKLNRYIGDADAYINEQLQIFEATIPVGSPTDQLTRLSNQLAVAFYYYYQNPDHPSQPITDVKKEIKDYIKTHYRKESADTESRSWDKTSGGISGNEP